jgi:hypothetical protein
MRQLMTAAVGLALAYGAASEPPVPLPLRLIVAGLVLAVVALFALWRPAGRPLEDWAFVLLRYWAIPRVAVWRPREVPVQADHTAASYEVVVPDPVWAKPVAAEEGGSRAAPW